MIQTKPKILFIDIETSPNLVLAWSCGEDQAIRPDQIVEERKIMCISYSWENSSEIRTVKWDMRHKDDKKLLERFMTVLNKADIVVGHNGDRFDLKWIKGRLLHHNLSPAALITSIDTLKLARREFNLNSFSLNYLGNYLGVGRKSKMDFQDWHNIVVYKSIRAFKKMVKYCENDVRLLKVVYKKLKPYVTLPVNMSTIMAGHQAGCRSCGSSHVQGNGLRATRQRTYQRMRCLDCGSVFQGAIIKSKEQRT